MILKDILKAIKIGFFIDVILNVLFFLCGFIFNGFDVYKALETDKNGLFLVSAIFIFIVAGMMLTGGKSKAISEKGNIKNAFSVIGYKILLLIFSVFTIISASIIDYILLSI